MPDTTTTQQHTGVRRDDGSGDHDRFSHYVRKEEIVRSNVDGVAVMALCGKKWIPHRNPDGYPICPTCNEIMNAIRDDSRGTDDPQ